MRCNLKSGDAIKIILCGSIRAAGEILKAKASLESMGNEVEVPEGVKNMLIGKASGSDEEKAEVKIRHGLILGYFNKIKAHEAVLVVNPEIEGVPGYIGGNTLIEMAFAHVLGKKLYCLYDVPELPYKSEILAMQPILLNGKLDSLA